MFFKGSAVDEDVVEVGKTEIKVIQDIVYEVLEGLVGVP